jgi:hypothetical protein
MSDQPSLPYESFSPPVGTILAYGGPLQVLDPDSNTLAPTLPSNWLVCDGRPVNREKYPKLFDAIQCTYGGDAEPMFNLPDLRGMFLRGVSRNADGSDHPDGDPDRESREAQVHPAAPNSPGNAKNDVGSRQPDDYRSHQHVIGAKNSTPGGSGILASGDGAGGPANGHTDSMGGKETRPRNVYVWWIIRAS